MAVGDGDLDVLLAELHQHDVLRLDPDGGIRAAYPFSTPPTAHLVDINAGPSVYAMCAIDALGMAAMLHATITIHSTDPNNGQPVTVTVDNGRGGWMPRSTVVLDAAVRASGDCCPPDAAGGSTLPSEERCCGVLNFFTDPASANTWLTDHPDVTGTIVTGKKALRIGAATFGHLLDS